MKTRLLKRLRKRAKKDIYIIYRPNYNLPYQVIINYDGVKFSEKTLEEALEVLWDERRKSILNMVRSMRIKKLDY